ncbi:TPA: hypothetical protein QDZ34_001097 [Stenotrophomonas maltophilia]|nr:hypothetical protein [Stenotrophomonas maltophilia]HDS1025466.1 hypothetical protein [Stenotrophomonas maltophilia]HDS1029139.1 hypothetical protein [Stenotrophomonas maltophilia]HDS1033771.1 hypothetical protein [Stenotrophomonas maltophilia]
MQEIEMLKKFISAMLEWETTLGKQKKTTDYRENRELRCNILASKGNELLDIFTNHLTSRALRTIAKARLDTLVTARPAEYSQKVLENTVETGDNATLICTQNEKCILPYRRYTLVRRDGEPRIDRVEGRISSDEEWHRIHSI